VRILRGICRRAEGALRKGSGREDRTGEG
jgi:hypothetical protein